MKRSVKGIVLKRKSFLTKKFVCAASVIVLLLFVVSNAIAQGGIPKAGEGFTEATKSVTGYFSKGILLMYAIGAVAGIVGAVKVYNKWNNGDQDTGKVASMWFGSCIFLVVVATILKGFFGV